jgi:hypothetical protein
MNHLAFGLPLLAVLLVAACSDSKPGEPSATRQSAFATVTSTLPPSPTATLSPRGLLETRVLDRFAELLGSGRENLVLQSLEDATWPDHCLGVARPGAPCQPGPVAGYSARIGYERETLTWEMHTDEPLDNVAWLATTEDQGAIAGLTDTHIRISGAGDLFADTISPGEIEVAIMPGTDFRTPLRELQEGSAVAFGIAGLPSSDVGALVWIEAR